MMPKQLWLVVGAMGLTLPGMILGTISAHPDPIQGTFLYGLAIIGTAFLLVSPHVPKQPR